MKFKFFAAAMVAATLLLALTACGKTQSPTASDNLDSTTQQTEQQKGSETSATEASSTNGGEISEDEAWKADFEKSLFENYGVIPKYYEDLGDGIYQVYVEVGGEVVPFVTVNSATGQYHG